MTPYSLNRLFSRQSSRCFDGAVDQGFFKQPGFLQGIENMRQGIRTLVDVPASPGGPTPPKAVLPVHECLVLADRFDFSRFGSAI